MYLVICLYDFNDFIGIWFMGGNLSVGCVEIGVNGVFGIVCDDNFNSNVVKVVCCFFG